MAAVALAAVRLGAVLDERNVVLARDGGNGIQADHGAKEMCHDDHPRLGPDGGLQLRGGGGKGCLIDVDGDGFACKWDPAIYRKIERINEDNEPTN